jgi:trehalose 6-phosphate synthase/phosphatase
MKKRLFIVSNRLPVNVEAKGEEVKVNLSSGGLVAAVTSFIDQGSEHRSIKYDEHYWVGAPCCTPAEWSQAKSQIQAGHFEYLPVFVNNTVYDLYYNGLSNSVIWPLFHYFPSYAEYDAAYYENYVVANQDFFKIIIRNVKKGDIVWIHDYHLLPLAGMIRESLPDLTIGFFLHIPFPSFELFRMMPAGWQQQLLAGIMGADLIGFHTLDYASHFLKCLQMVMGIEAENNIVKYKNRLVKIDFFPISISFEKFNSVFDSPEVVSLRNSYRTQFKGKKILFSVDRLDYTKGVYSRLKAYGWFLKNYPSYREKVVFIIVLVPSRDKIQKYAERKREIDEFIGSVNSTIGTISWKPIVYQYTHLNFTELISLYTACNLALITPLRDGMNLVSKEFVASRKDLKGVLVLSELTGAARELTDALLINPNDINGLAVKIKEGLEMNEQEQSRRMAVMQNRIIQYNVNTWAEDFLTQLNNIKVKQREFEFMFLDADSKRLLFQKYHASRRRLLLLDYDGTLVPFSALPKTAVPDSTLLEVLAGLSRLSSNSVYIVSGRDSNTLDTWLGHLPVNLIAEHGAKSKLAGGSWEVDRHIHADEDWKAVILPVMRLYEKRCANTFTENKEFSMVWHFRNADVEQGKIRASELYAELLQLTHHLNLHVVMGNKIIEVRTKGVDKGYLVRKLLKEQDYDFILACGDDATDEDMFRALANNESAVTIKIGAEASYAKYNLYTPQMTVSLLQYFLHPV